MHSALQVVFVSDVHQIIYVSPKDVDFDSALDDIANGAQLFVTVDIHCSARRKSIQATHERQMLCPNPGMDMDTR